MAGARWVQREILENNRNAKLKVYAAWFNMLASDDRSRWPQGLFSDPRVVEYWDEKKILGTWYGGHPDYEGYSGPVLWDAYLLYGSGSRWEDKPSERVGWGFTIVRTREQLRKDLLGLWGPRSSDPPRSPRGPAPAEALPATR